MIRSGNRQESCWLPLGMCAACDGDERNFIAQGVSFFPPGHPINLDPTPPGAELGPAACKPPARGRPRAAYPLALAGTTAKSRLVLATQSHALKLKRVARRQPWPRLFRDCRRQPGNEPLCNPTLGSCVYIDPWKQLSPLAHLSHLEYPPNMPFLSPCALAARLPAASLPSKENKALKLRNLEEKLEGKGGGSPCKRALTCAQK